MIGFDDVIVCTNYLGTKRTQNSALIILRFKYFVFGIVVTVANEQTPRNEWQSISGCCTVCSMNGTASFEIIFISAISSNYANLTLFCLSRLNSRSI